MATQPKKISDKKYQHNGRTYYVSDRKHKKYYTIVEGKKVHFGDTRYEHYYDKLGYYKYLNHNDKERRRLYKIRHEKDRHIKNTAGYFADRILW